MLSKLTYLAFDADSFSLNDDEMIKIMEGCSNLRSLLIRYEFNKENPSFTDYSIRKLPLFCPHIEKLHILSKNIAITTITDSSINSFVQLKQLETLSLKSFENVGDAVINVIKWCPKLRNLFLLNCKKVTNATIDALIASAKSQPSKKIRFNVNGESITSDGKKRRLPSNLKDASKETQQ